MDTADNFSINQAENRDDDLVAEAPSFSDGIDKVKAYILDQVVETELDGLETQYKGEGPKHEGMEDGNKGGDEHPFQQDCRTAYREIINRIRRTISGIVKREKETIETVLRPNLPNMEDDVQSKIDRHAVRNLMEAAGTLNKTLRAIAKFLRDRNLALNSPVAQKGEGYSSWKFWLPLLVIVLIETFANFIFLNPAAPLEKILVSVTAVVVVFVCGFAISWCLKVKVGIRTMNNKYRIWQKCTAWVGVVVFFLFFVLCLLFFIFYRAGENVSSLADVLPQLATAFTNNITDLGLALLNIVFLFVAIKTFLNTGWRIHKYGDVAKDREKQEQAYKEIRSDMDNKMRTIFDKSHNIIETLQKRADQIELNWNIIKEVCEHIPNISREAEERISEKYIMAVKKYREGFKEGWSPIAEHANDLSTQIPPQLLMNAAIDPLANPVPPPTGLKTLCDRDIPQDTAHFKQEVAAWKESNSKRDKLYEFAEKHIKSLKDRFRRERTNDNIQNSTTESEDPDDAR